MKKYLLSLSYRPWKRSEPEVKFEYGPLVRPSDIFSAWVTCNHCGFALWPFAGEMEVPKWDDRREKPH